MEKFSNLNKILGRPEVAQLEHTTLGVDEQILRLDVAMADPDPVDVGQRAEQLK